MAINILEHKGLIHKAINSLPYIPTYVDRQDLEQTGWETLCALALKHTQEKGTFYNYAYPVVYRKLLRYLNTHREHISFSPGTVKDRMLAKKGRISDQSVQEFDRMSKATTWGSMEESEEGLTRDVCFIAAVTAQQREKLYTNIYSLKSEYRTYLLMWLRNKSDTEISDKLGWSKNQIKSYRAYGIKELRKLMKKED